MTEQNNKTEAPQPPQRTFVLIKTFIKDVSFEAPGSPAIFAALKDTSLNSPEIKINCNARPLANNHYEYVLSIEATAKIGEKTAYLAEIQQAGIFRIIGHDAEELNRIDFRDRCPRELYPFAHEALHSLINKGGFGQEMLGNINFKAMFDNQQIDVDRHAQSMVKKQMGIDE